MSQPQPPAESGGSGPTEPLLAGDSVELAESGRGGPTSLPAGAAISARRSAGVTTPQGNVLDDGIGDDGPAGGGLTNCGGAQQVRRAGGASALNQGRTLNVWPLLVVLAAFTAGVGLIWADHWRRGSFMLGAACVLGGFLRLVLPQRMAGLLVVRSRGVDVVILAGLGAALMVLGLVVPGVFV